MIFGFNTDIKIESTVYHVQSEARTAEKLLQTQVFVKGQCIGKRAVPYAALDADSQNEEARHELLREQHRLIVQAIRDGHLDDVIEAASSKLAAKAPAAPIAPASAPAASDSSATPLNPLELKFLGSLRPSHDALLIRFGVALSSAPAEGALLQAQIIPDTSVTETFSGGSSQQAVSNHAGMVELTLPIPPGAQGEASLVVQVHHAGAAVAKKFRIKTKN